MRLVQTEPGLWSAEFPLPFGTTIYYKFIIDGQWALSNADLVTEDSNGIHNNTFTPAPVFIPVLSSWSTPPKQARTGHDIILTTWNSATGRLVTIGGR